jgi:hypothetical protein
MKEYIVITYTITAEEPLVELSRQLFGGLSFFVLATVVDCSDKKPAFSSLIFPHVPDGRKLLGGLPKRGL